MKIAALCAAALLICSLGACYELGPDTIDEYLALFDTKTKFISSGTNFLTLDTREVLTNIFTESAEDRFYVEDADGYEAACYRFIQLRIEKPCKLSEMSIYLKWDRSKSGSEARSTLGMQFFQLDAPLTEAAIKEILERLAKGEAADGDGLFSRTEADATANLTAGEWNDGLHVKFSSPFGMSEGDYFLIKFMENNDYNVTGVPSEGEDGEETYEFGAIAENDVAFMSDKIMFRAD